MQTNLLGRHPEGEDETNNLIVLLESAGMVELCRGAKSVYMTGPFALGYALYSLSDNGGEVNVEKVNHPDTMVSVAATWFSTPLDGFTMYARIWDVLNGRPINYEERFKPFDLSILSGQ